MLWRVRARRRRARVLRAARRTDGRLGLYFGSSRAIDCMYCIRLAFYGGLAYTGCEASRNLSRLARRLGRRSKNQYQDTNSCTVRSPTVIA